MTHVLNFALREILGDGVHQKGSLNNSEYARFDFSNNSQVCSDDIGKVEAICREQIKQKLPVYAKEVRKNDALAINGLRAVFGEDYPDPVRVVSIGVDVDELLRNPDNPTHANYSIEFCGGTHLANVGEAKSFAIISEEGISKGVRRIVAYTADAADKAIAEGEAFAAKLAAASSLSGDALDAEINTLKVQLDTAVIPAFQKAELRKIVATLIAKMVQFRKTQAAENKQKAAKLALACADEAAANGASYLITKVDVGLDNKACVEACAMIQKKFAGMAVMLLSSDPVKEKALVYATVPKELASKMSAGDWIKGTMEVLGGKGGGKPTSAQGQGPKWQNIDEAMQVAKEMAAMKL